MPSVCRCPATPRRRSAVDAWRCRVGHRPWLGRIVALLGLWRPGTLERELDPLFEGSFVLGLALTLEGSQDIAPRPRWWRLETRCLGLLRHQRRRSVVAGSLRRLPPVSRGCARRTARAVVNTDNARPEPWQLSGHIPPGCEQPRWRCGCRTYVPSHVRCHLQLATLQVEGCKMPSCTSTCELELPQAGREGSAPRMVAPPHCTTCIRRHVRCGTGALDPFCYRSGVETIPVHHTGLVPASAMVWLAFDGEEGC